MLGFREDQLTIYLNDHLAGSSVGVDLARSLAEGHAELAAIAGEIEEDRDSLIEVMTLLSVGRDHVKATVAGSAAKLGRLRFKVVGTPALGRFEQLETLSLGVEGKLALWTVLENTHAADPRLAGVDLGRLIERARSQRARLEEIRLHAAAAAFAS